MSYSSIENYIEETHYDEIFEKISYHYNEIKGHLDLHTYAVPYPKYIKLEDISVEKIYFKDDILDEKNEFKLVVLAEFIIKGDHQNDYEDDTNYRKFIVTCNGVVNNGIEQFHIVEVEEYITQPYQYKKSLSEFSIPYISTDDLDERAELFLRKYYNEALEIPMALPIKTVLYNMGVTAYNAPLGKSIFGKTFFEKSVEKIEKKLNQILTKLQHHKTKK